MSKKTAIRLLLVTLFLLLVALAGITYYSSNSYVQVNYLNTSSNKNQEFILLTSKISSVIPKSNTVEEDYQLVTWKFPNESEKVLDHNTDFAIYAVVNEDINKVALKDSTLQVIMQDFSNLLVTEGFNENPKNTKIGVDYIQVGYSSDTSSCLMIINKLDSSTSRVSVYCFNN